MVLGHVIGMFINPETEWERIRAKSCDIGTCMVTHVLLLAALPPVAGLVGTTQIGWRIGARAPVKLTFESGLMLAVAYYLAMIVGVLSIGYTVHWMAQTYNSQASLGDAVALAAYTATPLFLIGVMQLYPVLWMNFLVGLPALAYTVYLLYTGVPILMRVEPERGFLFSSAVLGVGLVALVSLLAVTALLWGIGFGPSFTH
ncbi:MAG: Yip1 family protein [Gammaproteobacteria bacterium]